MQTQPYYDTLTGITFNISSDDVYSVCELHRLGLPVVGEFYKTILILLLAGF